jgi:hypothetical protein
MLSLSDNGCSAGNFTSSRVAYLLEMPWYLAGQIESEKGWEDLAL